MEFFLWEGFFFIFEKDYTINRKNQKSGENLLNAFQSFFYQKVNRFIRENLLIHPGDRIVAAVSGGADSVAMLCVLDSLARDPSFPFFELHVAHLNHGLRGDAAKDDARFVRRLAEKMGLPCTVGRVDAEAFRRRHGLSLEDAARQLRYRFLEQTAGKVGAGKVAVGHTRDDQVETVLLHFLRGTGLDGLSGMKVIRPLDKEARFLIRPLLECSRREIEDFCSRLAIKPRVDETNRDMRFRRNRIRQELIPHLERTYNPRFRESMGRLSYILGRENDFLEELAGKHLTQHMEEGSDYRSVYLDGAGFCREHEALQARMIRTAVSRLLGTFPRDLRFEHIRAIMGLFCGQASRGELHLPGGLRAVRRYERLALTLERAAPRDAFTPAVLPVPGESLLLEGRCRIRARRVEPGRLTWPPQREKEAFLDVHRVVERMGEMGDGVEAESDALELLVRPRQAGDRFYPLGAPGSKKLKDYFIDIKIPREERDAVPLVVAGETIVWVAGHQVSELCRITDDTKEALVLQLDEPQDQV